MSDAAERAEFLETLVLLHNFRIRTGHPNQISSVYSKMLAARAVLEDDATGVPIDGASAEVNAARAAAAAAIAAGPIEGSEEEGDMYADDPAFAMIADLGVAEGL